MSCFIRQASQEVDDEYHRSATKAEEKSYYSVAHTVHEHVTEQASIMVNGKLKEYQVCLYMYSVFNVIQVSSFREPKQPIIKNQVSHYYMYLLDVHVSNFSVLSANIFYFCR